MVVEIFFYDTNKSQSALCNREINDWELDQDLCL